MFSTYGASPYSTSVGGTWLSGSAVDFGSSGMETCWAVQNVGDLDETGTMTNRLQETDTPLVEGSWVDVVGAVFSQVSSARHVEAIQFERTKRYVRGVGDVTGPSVLWTFGIVVGDVPPYPVSSTTVLGAALYTTTIGPVSWVGNSVDFGAAPGEDCWAILNAGDFDCDPGPGSMSVRLIESDDGTTWTNVSGGSFTTYDSANHVEAITFTRTKRYVRAAGTGTGDGLAATLGVLVGDVPSSTGGQKKTPSWVSEVGVTSWAAAN